MINIQKAQITLELAHLEGRLSKDEIQKARTTKYYRREGSPGSYKYYYTKEEYDKGKGGGEEDKIEKEKHEKFQKYKKQMGEAVKEKDKNQMAKIYNDYVKGYREVTVSNGKFYRPGQKTVITRTKMYNKKIKELVKKEEIVNDPIKVEKMFWTDHNSKRIKQYLTNKGAERHAYSASSSYFNYKGYKIRVSDHHWTSEKHSEPDFNAYSYEPFGYKEIIQDIENLVKQGGIKEDKKQKKMNIQKALYTLELSHLSGQLSNEEIEKCRNQIEKSWSKDLQSKFPNGKWVTMSGARVFVNGGKVVAGLDGFNKEIDKFFDSKKQGDVSYSKTVDGRRVKTTEKVVESFNSAKDLKDYIEKIPDASKSSTGANTGNTKYSFKIPLWVKDGDKKLFFNKTSEGYEYNELIQENEIVTDQPKEDKKETETKGVTDKEASKGSEDKSDDFKLTSTSQILLDTAVKRTNVDEGKVKDIAKTILSKDSKGNDPSAQLDAVAEAIHYANLTPEEIKENENNEVDITVKDALKGEVFTGRLERIIEVDFDKDVTKTAKDLLKKKQDISEKLKGLGAGQGAIVNTVAQRNNLDLNQISDLAKEVSQLKNKDIVSVAEVAHKYIHKDKGGKEGEKTKKDTSKITLDTFRGMAKESKDVKDFVKKIRETTNVPPEVASEFNKKYGEDGKISPEKAAEKLFNEAMGDGVSNVADKLNKKFNVKGDNPSVGMPIKGIKQIYTDGEYKGKNVGKDVQRDAEKLINAANEGNIEQIKDIKDKYFSEWNKSKSKAGTQRERYVPVDTSKVEIYNIANAMFQEARAVTKSDYLNELSNLLPNDINKGEEINKSDVYYALESGMGTDQIKFKKKGSEIKDKIRPKYEDYLTRHSGLKTALEEAKQEVVDTGVEIKAMDEYGYPVFNHTNNYTNPTETDKKIDAFNNLRYKCEDINKDIKAMRVLLENLEDGKSYELSARQLMVMEK